MRNIYITGTIELKTVNEVVAALHEDKDGDVTIWICSEGGDAYAGLGLYDVLHRWGAAGHKVDTVAVWGTLCGYYASYAVE
jgi:ATP-dependent protease ClpP protease subunit